MIEALIAGVLALLGVNTGFLASVNFKLGHMAEGLDQLERRMEKVELKK